MFLNCRYSVGFPLFYRTFFIYVLSPFHLMLRMMDKTELMIPDAALVFKNPPTLDETSLSARFSLEWFSAIFIYGFCAILKLR